MRIVIDLQSAQGPSRHRGIGRYSLALTRAMARTEPEHEIFVLVNGLIPNTIEDIKAALQGFVPAENIVMWTAPGPVHTSDPHNNARREAAELIREAALAALSPDYVLVTSLFEGFGDDIVTSIGVLHSAIPTATILHDLIPLIHRPIYLANADVETWYQNKLGHLRRSDLLLSNSESSRQEALTWIGSDPEQVINISSAADDHFTPGKVSSDMQSHLAERYGLIRPFVMYTGGIDHRKNIEGLICAYAQLPVSLRTAHQLAIVCSVQDADRSRLLKLAADEGLGQDELVLTGFIPEDDLLACYRSCKLFVFPSWHEGFGLPALEAMKCGRAVIVGDRSSLPEVVGLERAFFDPFDIASISQKMREVLTNDKMREDLERHGLKQALEFDWDKTAMRAWSALEAGHAQYVASSRPPSLYRRTSSDRRPRLALVSPFAPDSSGISDYSADLLPDLARHYRIDVITASGKADEPSVLGNCPVRDLTWFRQHAQEFDRVLYHFGNSHFHTHMFDLLHVISGVVVLHDFFLSGAVSYREGSGEVPGAWTRNLSYSHGWPAVTRRFQAPDPHDVLWEYPCNLPVLQDALGVIVHAEHSRDLAREWYGEKAGQDWHVIPLLRRAPIANDRVDPRRELGIPVDDFVVCSFGLLGQSKMNHRLIKAWLESPMARDPQCRLVFVGQNTSDKYGEKIEKMVRSARVAGQIEITGWADHTTFEQWLNVANVGVQLRQLSRGETSAAVFDCMNHAMATIVNAHGSMAELPRDAVYLLDDEFNDAELSTALTELWRDADRRRALGRKAKAHMQRHHQPRRCANAYAKAIEQYYDKAAIGEYGLMNALLESGSALTHADWSSVATAIARNLPASPRPRRLLVDVSVLVQVDARSGIQRVVRAILSQWLETPPPGWTVEPIYADLGNNCYRYAQKFTCKFLGIPDDWCDDDIVEPCMGDSFIGLDYHPDIAYRQRAILHEWRQRGVKVQFVVYDLLPVLLPDRFPSGTPESHERWLETIAGFDGAICISRAVAGEFKDWLEQRGPKRERPFAINWFHLGADTHASKPTTGMPDDAERTLARLRASTSFLAVGTIEPRKGHQQLLDAFDALWNDGIRANLVIVGKLGWMMEYMANKLRNHPQYNKQLFWLESISDEYLDAVYAACSVLIVASEGEGFGLPLVEAARHGLPVLARDIPVFREVAGSGAVAFFANSRDPKAIQKAVTLQLKSIPKIDPAKISWKTWAGSAQDLAEYVVGH
ncbi:glycosyltransferase [Novosphingobium sp. BL-52-GroH]|uniref:glycosyltransferase n=1 Tax=Novosphingobium sp. BL-52-GroH TaxID=3349877 RepID=UPI00384D0B98